MSEYNTYQGHNYSSHIVYPGMTMKQTDTKKYQVCV